MSERLAQFDATRDLSDKGVKALCYAPFVQMSFSPNGDASACCLSRSYALGNLRDQRLDEIWNGQRMRQFRKMLEKYVWPPGCETCQWAIEAGNLRDNQIVQFDRYPVGTEEIWPSQLEFAVSNVCNLACIQCDGDYSSVIRAQQGLPPLPKSYDDQFFEDLRKYLPHLVSASFLGGEPFLQEECYRIWNMLIELEVPPTCTITTNGSIYDEKVERILHSLPVNLSISIDGVTKETVESIRVNNKFDVLMRTIERLDEYAKSDRGFPDRRERNLTLNFCLMRQNWQELADFFLFAEQLEARAWTVIATYPDHCSIFKMPPHEIEHIVQTFEKKTPEMESRLSRHNLTVWFELVRELRGHLEQGATEVARMAETNFRNRGQSASPVYRLWSLLHDGKLEEALAAAKETQPHDPLFYNALIAIAEIETENGNLEEAERSIDEAVRLSKRRPDAFLRLAWLRLQQVRPDEAVQAFEKARDLAAKVRGLEDWVKRGLHELEAHLQSPMPKAQLLIAQGKHDEALAAASKVEPSDPLFYDASVLIAELHTTNGEPDRAEQSARDAIRCDDQRPEAYFKLATLRAKQHRLEEATRELDTAKKLTSTTHLRRAIRELETYLNSPMSRAWASMNEGNHDAALTAARETAPSDPLFYEANALIAEIHTANGDTERAEQRARDVTHDDEQRPEAFLRLASLRAKQHRLEEAARELDTAKTLTSATTEAHVEQGIEELETYLKSPMSRAWALMSTGQRDTALAAALETTASDPLYYEAKVLIAEILTTNGEPDLAEQSAQDAIRYDDQRPDGFLRIAHVRVVQERPTEVARAVETAKKLIASADAPKDHVTHSLLELENWLARRAHR